VLALRLAKTQGDGRFHFLEVTMEYNVTNELLGRDLWNRMTGRPSELPDWLSSALGYPPQTPGGANQQGWPVQTDVDPAAGGSSFDRSGWNPGNKRGQDVPRTRADIGRGRAALLGAAQGVSAEFGDELAGGYAAGSTLDVNARRPVGMALQTLLGLARLGYETWKGQRGAATETYEHGRDQFRADAETAREQYPDTYYTANVAAGAAIPASRVVQAATLPARMTRGALAGGVFGGLSGVGGGETWPDRAVQGVVGAGVGGAVGAGVGAVAPAIVDGVTRAGRAALRRMAEASDMASSAMTGARNAPRVRANWPQRIWDPPTDLPQRSIELDYPQGVPANAAGKITQTIEGEPIRAQHVFGWEDVNKPQNTLQSGDRDSLAKAFMKKTASIGSGRQMQGSSGISKFDEYGRLIDILLHRRLHPLDRPKVYAHELAHAIDEFAGQLPTKGLLDELKVIYNTLNNPKRTSDGLRAAPGSMVTPETHGYKGGEVSREYAVEAIRAYLTNANYIKTVAPRTAAAIREFFNDHPFLSRIVQFNSLVAAPAATGLVRTWTPDQAGPGL
jgi:hypothetical protein